MIKAIYILTSLLAISPDRVTVDTVAPNTDKWEIFDFIIEKGGKEAYRFPEKGAKKENLVIDRGIKYEKFINPDKTQCGVKTASADPYGFFAVPTKTTTKIGIWSKADFREPKTQYQIHMKDKGWFARKVSEKTKERIIDQVGYLPESFIDRYPIYGPYQILDKKNHSESGTFYLFHQDYFKLITSPMYQGTADYVTTDIYGEEKVIIANKTLDALLTGDKSIVFVYSEVPLPKQPCKRRNCFSTETVLALFPSDLFLANSEFKTKIEQCRKQASNNK